MAPACTFISFCSLCLVIAGLNVWFASLEVAQCSQGNGLQDMAANRIAQMRNDTKVHIGHPRTVDPMERVRKGFEYFKKEKFELSGHLNLFGF